VRTWIRSEEDEGKYEEYEDIIKELDPPLMAVLPLVIGREDETLGRPSSSQAPSHVLQNRFALKTVISLFYLSWFKYSPAYDGGKTSKV